ncbi:hypothetical protein DYH55_21430 [Methylovirgula sp. 4M-Z18]|nr:hypothetical protein DYH55_21430 [Methylovirgula sp. 4M-Z18]
MAGAALIAGAAVVAVSLSATPAAAMDDGQDTLVNSFMGLIKLDPTDDSDKPQIDYHERAPLVLPPKMDLPPPRAAQAKATNWPQDPDVLKHQRAIEAAKQPGGIRTKDKPEMSKQELMANRADQAPVKPGDDYCRNHENTHWCVYARPEELSNNRISDDSNVGVGVGSEPARSDLTDPPKGYRTVTQKVKPGFEAPKKDTSSDPKAYWREQSANQY